MVKSLKELIELSKKQETMTLAVASAHDDDVILAVEEAYKLNIVKPILVGDSSKIHEIAKKHKLSINEFEIINEADPKKAANIAVRLVSENKADFLMKGLVDTAILLKEILNKDYGLRTDRQLSHVVAYELKTYHKLLFFTDGGMNISPNLYEKIEIVKNALDVIRATNNKNIKVGCLAAKEKVNENMKATVDADQIKKLAHAHEFGDDVIVEGPLAFDLLVSREAAKIKNFKSEISGDVDLVLVPTIEVGNAVGKALTYLADAKSAGIIMGAKVPVVLVSRADDAEDKLNSIALGSVIANYKK